MINKLVQSFFDIIFSVFGLFASIITAPIFLLLGGLFPDLYDYYNSFTLFITRYLFPGIAYAREVFFNVTHFPRSLYALFIGSLLARITFHFASLALKFIIHTYRSYRGFGGTGGDMSD